MPRIPTPYTVRKIGILGGGHLGRMLALAGVPLGLQFYFYDPAPYPCARDMGHCMQAGWDQKGALGAFCDEMDRITYETDAIPAHVIHFLQARSGSVPTACLRLLTITQDRWAEHTCLQDWGIPVPLACTIDTATELETVWQTWGQVPVILKPRTTRTPGTSQVAIQGPADLEQLKSEWPDLYGTDPAHLIAEQQCPYIREWSLIGVRSLHGDIRFYDLCLNQQDHGNLRISIPISHIHQPMVLPPTCGTIPPLSGLIPAYSQTLTAQAQQFMHRVFEATGYIGVLALTFFEKPDGTLLVHRVIPRVHHAGHWTIEGARISQFENHLRAILGWPLGSTETTGRPILINWIGKCPALEPYLADPHAHIHVYNKTPAPLRKVGHVTYVYP